MFDTLINPPSTMASAEDWRKYLLHLSGLDHEDVAVKIALKSARDIISMKDEMARIFSGAHA